MGAETKAMEKEGLKEQIFSKIGVHRLVEDLKLGKSVGSYSLATHTLRVLLKLVTDTDWETASELIDTVKEIGQEVTRADPTETVAGNLVLRVLKLIRDEYGTALGHETHQGPDVEESLEKVWTTEEDLEDSYDRPLSSLKESVTDSIQELMSELETSGENIASQALEHVYSNEVIMTLGKSKTVQAFLKQAAKKRRLQVIVAECAPFYNGHELAISLAEVGINTTVIPDSAIFAIMSRVNKVIIGTHSVMANGGLKAACGAYSLALAAKYYSVPLIVCTAMFKFTPQYLVSHEQVAFNRFASPQQVMPYDNGQVVANCEVVNPVFDYVPPELITIFISNIGGNAPSYVYRLLSELYHRKDYLP
jgi:translation initiation factor eIF-2B subunit beta